MKKIIIVSIIFLSFLIVFVPKKVKSNDELRGVFISYIEEKRYLKNNYEESIKSMVKNIKDNKFNLIILQVRSFSDSIYKSNIFPWSNLYHDNNYVDILNLFIDECKKNNIRLYAWINPYRVSSSNDIQKIQEQSPAYKYIGTDTLYINKGIFFNPSKQEVEDLIVEGVKEVVTNYKVDGILFDDYFYPSTDLDINDYNNYLSKNNFLSLEDYHLMIINKMVKRVYETCKENNVEFGISPDGNINNNYTYISADIYKWLDSDEYVDFIMPQIYYGFFNETMPFYETINVWNDAIKNDNIKLLVALAMYKSGNVDNYAKSGSEEWLDNKDIIKREIILSRNLSHYKGFALFRYDNLFTDEIITKEGKEEFKNLKKILN